MVAVEAVETLGTGEKERGLASLAADPGSVTAALAALAAAGSSSLSLPLSTVTVGEGASS